MTESGTIEPPPNRPIRLKNVNCVYCNVDLSTVQSTKEHVIARGFIPRGKLDGCWNLIVNACKDCNDFKSNLEDDIATITMLPGLDGKYASDDPALAEEVARRASKSFSRRTKKLVKDSSESMTIKGELVPGVSITFNMQSHPQLDFQRAYELARLHLVAFFFFITYDHEKQRGHYWIGDFVPVNQASKNDWGNNLMVAFADLVKDWDNRMYAVTADGFFKLIIKAHDSSKCWAWAVEWNKKFRQIGFFGDPSVVDPIADSLPELTMTMFEQNERGYIRGRTEVPLDPEKDILFDPPARDSSKTPNPNGSDLPEPTV